MFKKLSKNNQKKYLNVWIQETLKDETPLSLKKHIVRHAKEIFKKDPHDWLASMKNLIEAFEFMHDIKLETELRLKKLDDKYKKNPRRYTPPPKIKNFKKN